MPANKPFILGLTGGIGCGKSAAAAFLRELGAAHIDADGISRALTAPDGEALDGIRSCFGDEVFKNDGSLDRSKLGEIVFSNENNKRALEGILHPMVQRRVMDEIENAGRNGYSVVVLDVPLLFETGMDVLCDEVWTMSVPEEVQIDRVCERDGMTPQSAIARINGQMCMEERNRNADKVIDSNRSIEATQAELRKLYTKLLHRLA